MKKAGEILKVFFDTLGISAVKTETIYSGWKEIAGKEIAENSRVVDVKKEILFVEADHPGWIQIINLKENLILEKINEKFPEKKINKIKIILKKR